MLIGKVIRKLACPPFEELYDAFSQSFVLLAGEFPISIENLQKLVEC